LSPLFFFALVHCSKSNILSLNQENFDSVIQKNEKVVVNFFSPWNDESIIFAPLYKKVSEKFSKKHPDLVFAEVDTTQNVLLYTRFDIINWSPTTPYPSVKLFLKGKIINYNGENSEFESWLEDAISPSRLTPIDASGLDKYLSTTKKAAVASFSPSSPVKEKFRSIVQDFHYDTWKFFIIENQDVEQDTMNLYINGKSLFEESAIPPLPITEKTSAASLLHYLCSFGSPRIEPFSVPVERRMKQCGKPIVIFWTGNAPKKELKVLTQTAQHFIGSLQFTHAPCTHEWQDAASHKGQSGKVFPILILVKNNSVINYDEDIPVTEENMKNWLNKCLNGTVKNWKKSKPIPTENPGPVIVVVGRTFESIVEDPTKDVLMLYWAKACPHSQALMPVLDELATVLKPFPSIVIAKMETTMITNQPPDYIETIDTWPTIHFFTGNNVEERKKPIVYSGTRTVKNFVEFIKQHSTNPINIETEGLSDKIEQYGDGFGPLFNGTMDEAIKALGAEEEQEEVEIDWYTFLNKDQDVEALFRDDDSDPYAKTRDHEHFTVHPENEDDEDADHDHSHHHENKKDHKKEHKKDHHEHDKDHHNKEHKHDHKEKKESKKHEKEKGKEKHQEHHKIHDHHEHEHHHHVEHEKHEEPHKAHSTHADENDHLHHKHHHHVETPDQKKDHHDHDKDHHDDHEDHHVATDHHPVHHDKHDDDHQNQLDHHHVEPHSVDHHDKHHSHPHPDNQQSTEHHITEQAHDVHAHSESSDHHSDSARTHTSGQETSVLHNEAENLQ